MGLLGRLLGLDVGEKRIGVAVSDELGCLAQALTVLERRGLEADLAALAALAEETGAVAVVVGLPHHMAGGEGTTAPRVRKLAEALKARLGLPVHFQDERLSTREAERLLVAGDMTRRRRRGVVDKVAAALILQGYLDRQRAAGASGGLS